MSQKTQPNYWLGALRYAAALAAILALYAASWLWLLSFEG